ncbi:hypothetical protein QWJ34_26405 [Saccharibacillus sp. CPCC 101409]|uniref:hypothetical protein n=1 Tax=Saccharibacillus sp. CPCC 101409 TaxID=3058041 RepID=UPI002672B0C6|nr:hypothetical protein [Saccharibacillus sp. CPCC 101409]MDO3413312.1 hypothetical protein [Saccharibacillus sp. CPCC 101409]
MNEREKNASIDRILARGLVKPSSAGKRISVMLRELGLRFIFWDTGYSLFFAGLTLACVFALFMLAPESYRASASVAVSPLLILLAVLFAGTSERLGGLYEIKQTCRYTIGQIAVLRMICYSVLGAAFTAAVAFAGADGELGFAALFPLCLSALLICAILSLSVLQRAGSRWGYAAFSAVWLFASVALPFGLGDKWEHLLRGMPLAFSIGFAAAGAALFVWQISKMLREVNPHVIA